VWSVTEAILLGWLHRRVSGRDAGRRHSGPGHRLGPRDAATDRRPRGRDHSRLRARRGIYRPSRQDQYSGCQRRGEIARRCHPVRSRRGPSLDALANEGILQTDDLALESRWPKFSARAHDETGVTSILSFRLTAREGRLGALNLFSKQTAAFGDEAREIGLLFAIHAAVALQASRRTEKLLAALQTRDLIGQAKGILMEREQITDDQAFQILVRASQRLNIKLTVVASRLAEDKSSSARHTANPSHTEA
jgi:GAF domain-containing protein